MDEPLILASQSPRRIEMGMALATTVILLPAEVDETLPPQISPRDAVLYLSLKKALAAEASALAAGHAPGTLLLSADTIVATKQHILGKPKTKEEARQMIQSIQGTCHQVLTGVCLLRLGQPIRTVFAETTWVFCNPLTEAQVEAYIDTAEPYDKAGGYGIQGAFGAHIHHIEGDYDNVVGLPLCKVSQALASFPPALPPLSQ